MERITDISAAVAPDAWAETGSPGHFTEGDPGLNIVATRINGAWAERVQEEICAVVEHLRGGVVLDPANPDQMWENLRHTECLYGADASEDIGEVGVGGKDTPYPTALIACPIGAANIIESVGSGGCALIVASKSASAVRPSAVTPMSFVAACDTVTVNGERQILLGCDTVDLPDDGVQQGAICCNDMTGFTWGAGSVAVASNSATDFNGASSFLAASTAADVDADANYCAAIAADTPTISDADYSASIASATCTVQDGAQLAVIASELCTVGTTGSKDAAVIASILASVTGSYSAAIASYSVDLANASSVAGDFAAIIASANANNANGNFSIIAASQHAVTESSSAAIIASSFCRTDNGSGPTSNQNSILVGSYNAELASGFTLAGGYSITEPTWNGTNQNLTWRIMAATGNGYAAAWNVGGVDYAEMFELDASQNAQPIEPGCLVGLVGDKVRTAQSDDDIIGVLSARPGVLGGDGEGWQGRYQTDEWGRVVMADGIPQDRPDYDPSKGFVQRKDRPTEWAAVALLGQVRARVSADVSPGCYIGAGADGLGVVSATPTKIRCMKITSAFDSEKGYGIALVFVG